MDPSDPSVVTQEHDLLQAVAAAQMLPHGYLINLESSQARLHSAQTELEKIGCSWDRVEAVDGRGRAAQDFASYDDGHARSWMGRSLSGPELGCYLSHLACIERFLASDAETCLVFEDDLFCHPEAGAVIGETLSWLNQSAAEAWQMVNLGRPVKHYASPVTRLAAGGDRALFRAHYFPDTTTALLWSRPGAEAFMQASQTIYAPIDHFLRVWNLEADAGYGFQDAPITTTGAMSDIRGAAQARHPGRSLLYQFRKHRRLVANKRAARNNQAGFQAMRA